MTTTCQNTLAVLTTLCSVYAAHGQTLNVTSRNGQNLALCGPAGLPQIVQHAFTTGTNTADMLDVSAPGTGTMPSSGAGSYLGAQITPLTLQLTQNGQASRSAFGAYATADARDEWTFSLSGQVCFSLHVSLDSNDADPSSTVNALFQFQAFAGLIEFSDGTFTTAYSHNLAAPGTWFVERTGVLHAGTYRLSLFSTTDALNIPTYLARHINSVTLAIDSAACGSACDSIDFNNDGLFPDTADIDDFLSVFSGGPCSTDPVPGCSDIDFNNDGLFPDTLDIDSLLSVFSGGPCL